MCVSGGGGGVAEVFVNENNDFVRLLLILCHIQASKCARPVGKSVEITQFSDSSRLKIR